MGYEWFTAAPETTHYSRNDVRPAFAKASARQVDPF
jgi:hypothetical protein